MPPSRPFRSVLLLLVGGVLLAPTHAEAGDKRKHLRTWDRILQAETEDVVIEGLIRRRLGVVVGSDIADEVDAVEVRVSSDGGDEELVLTETDAWLHGGAALAALPAKTAALSLTLYDTGSASFVRFSGTLAPDGAVTLGAGESTGTCEIVSKLGCVGITAYDVEVLGAEVYPDGDAYLLTFDLAGADTYAVAYATVEVGGDKAEVAWDDVGAVWEAEATLDHTGEIRVRATARDARGATVDNVDAELAEPWDDGGAGVAALAAGADTRVAVHRWDGNDDDGAQPGTWSGSGDIVSVVSGGWTDVEYPTHAEVTLAGGGTVTVPANSYQRTGALFKIGDEVEVTILSVDRDERLRVWSGDIVLLEVGPDEVGETLCADGLCATLLADGAGGYRPALTAYAEDPAALGAVEALRVEVIGEKGATEARRIVLDDAISAVFAARLETDGDPLVGDASGSVNLLGAADRRGRQATLSRGSFYGGFVRDEDGELGFGGYGTDDWATAESDAAVALGEAVVCGGAGCDEDWVAPVIVYAASGKGGTVRRPRASVACRLWSSAQ